MLLSASFWRTLGFFENIFKISQNESLKIHFLFIRQYVKFLPVMRLNRYFYPFLFIFALLFAQQGGVVHALHHVIEEQQDHSLPHDKLCDLCAEYAQIGSAIGSSLVFFAPLEQTFSYIADTFTEFHSSPFTAFAARAPPYSA